MGRAKSQWLISLEYYPLRGILWLLAVLPANLALAVSMLSLKIIFSLLPKRRRIVDDNLKQTFPQLNQDARRVIANGSFENVSRTILMLSKMPNFSPEDWQRLISVEGFEHVQKALGRGRGVIAFTAHYGCWEAMAAYLPRLVRSAIVVRPLNNPRLDAAISKVRTSGGGQLIPKDRTFPEGLKALRRNDLLGILIDQNFAPGRLFVDFFNRPAATTPVVSLLAKKTGAAVMPLHNICEKDGRIRIIFEPALKLSQHPERIQAIAEDTQQMTHIVEGWIRKHPHQWFWLHRRWKRRPQTGEWVHNPGVDRNQPILCRV